jgi:hypothetical protein
MANLGSAMGGGGGGGGFSVPNVSWPGTGDVSAGPGVAAPTRDGGFVARRVGASSGGRSVASGRSRGVATAPMNITPPERNVAYRNDTEASISPGEEEMMTHSDLDQFLESKRAKR